MYFSDIVRHRPRTRSLAAALLAVCLYAAPVIAAPDQPADRKPRVAGHPQTALSLLLSPGAATIAMLLTAMLLARRPRVTPL